MTTLDRGHTTQHGSPPHLMFVRLCQTCAFHKRAERALWPTPRQTSSWPHHVGIVRANLPTCWSRAWCDADYGGNPQPRVSQLLRVASFHADRNKKYDFLRVCNEPSCVRTFFICDVLPLFFFLKIEKTFLFLFSRNVANNIYCHIWGCSRLCDTTTPQVASVAAGGPVGHHPRPCCGRANRQTNTTKLASQSHL